MNKSAARALDILNVLAKSNKSLTQLEISQILDLPKSSTFELLYTMLEKGILEFDNEALKTFRLSLKVFELGMSVMEKTDLPKIARPCLEKLSRDSHETVFLAVEDQGSIVYLDRVEETSSITTSVGLGVRRPMYCTGLGKALLAGHDEDKVKLIWDKADKVRYTNYTIRNYEDLLAELEKTRERGYAVDDREVENEIFCVAAPLYDRLNKAVGAISIASLYVKMDTGRTAAFGKMVIEAALAISKRLGFRRDNLYVRDE
ncbi:MAG: IclR family transcriptional regulator [Negativicutes bacterium]|nr:IclR family transcriptional regulator [Negativicutes bacterium]